MRPKPDGLLWDIVRFGSYILDQTTVMTFEDYEADLTVRLAVERAFLNVGEAAKRLLAVDAQFADQLSGVRNVVAFRNVLAHQYDSIENAKVWGILTEYLPELVEEARALLAGHTASES